MDTAKLFGQGGAGAADMWSASATIERGALVVSPADNEVYRRVAATGVSSTDPADDTAAYVAASYTRITALPAGYPLPVGASDVVRGIAKTAQVNIAKDVRTLVLGISGRGRLLHLGNFRSANNATRVEIRIDGRATYAWEGSIATDHYVSHVGAASKSGTDIICTPTQPIDFRRVVEVWITPLVSGWVGANEYVGYAMRTEA